VVSEVGQLHHSEVQELDSGVAQDSAELRPSEAADHHSEVAVLDLEVAALDSEVVKPLYRNICKFK
jgi:hypothetical protein